jgi:hypothetical protein
MAHKIIDPKFRILLKHPSHLDANISEAEMLQKKDLTYIATMRLASCMDLRPIGLQAQRQCLILG